MAKWRVATVPIETIGHEAEIHVGLMYLQTKAINISVILAGQTSMYSSAS